MKRFLKIFLIAVFVFMASTQTVYAQLTILPSTDLSEQQCIELLKLYETGTTGSVSDTAGIVGYGDETNDLLGCAIKTGRISLGMVPFFIKYIANFLIALIGLITVLFIIIGGYFYIYGGLTEQKEKGKNFIKHAILGMVIALLSWVAVNVIISLVTQ
jgi:hypothetical protein